MTPRRGSSGPPGNRRAPSASSHRRRRACRVPENRHRISLFVPGAIAIAAVGAGTVYWAATAETTAVSTLPSIPHPGVAGPVLTAASQGTHPMIVSAPLIPHPVAGRSQCKQCHAPAGLKPIGADHEGRPVESCRICHRPAPEPEAAAVEATSGLPGPIPHSIEGEISKNCILCHGTGKVKPFPDSHASFAVASCFACHKRASNAK